MIAFLFFLLAAAAVLSLIVWGRSFRYLKKAVFATVMQKLCKNENMPHQISTYIVTRATDLILKAPTAQREFFLREINAGRVQSIKTYLDTQVPGMSGMLQAQPPADLSLVKCNKTACFYAAWYHLYYDCLLPVEQLMPHLRKWRKSPFEQNIYRLLTAYILMYKGDLRPASEKAMQSINFFRRHLFIYELEKAYLLLVQMYETAGYLDHADLILNQAIETIGRRMGPSQQIEFNLQKSRILIKRKLFSEARVSLRQTLKLARRYKQEKKEFLALELLSWVFFNLHQAAKGYQYAAAAHKIAERLGNERMLGEACLNMLKCCWRQKKYPQTENLAVEAARHFLKTQSMEQYTDSIFFQFKAVCALKQSEKAKKIMRKLLKLLTQYSTIYFPSDIYFTYAEMHHKMKKNNLTLRYLKKALNDTLTRGRYEVAANVALSIAHIEAQRKNKASQQKYAAMALDFAGRCGDTRLSRHIQTQLEKISVK